MYKIPQQKITSCQPLGVICASGQDTTIKINIVPDAITVDGLTGD